MSASEKEPTRTFSESTLVADDEEKKDEEKKDEEKKDDEKKDDDKKEVMAEDKTAARSSSSWRFKKQKSTAVDASVMILSALKEASQASGMMPYVGLAAALALEIVNSAQGAKDNKDLFKRLADDACSFVLNIADVCEELTKEQKQLSPSLNRHLETLTTTLTQIKDFAHKRADKAYWKRYLSSKSDLDRIKEFRERLAQALGLFGVQSQITIREHITRMATRQETFHEEIRVTFSPRQTSPEPTSPTITEPLTDSPQASSISSRNPFTSASTSRAHTPQPRETPRRHSSVDLNTSTSFDDVFKDFLSNPTTTVAGTITVNNVQGNSHVVTNNSSNVTKNVGNVYYSTNYHPPNGHMSGMNRGGLRVRRHH